ncbi:MAG: peptidoglycan-binding protein [Candidatus Liptonbacteria bacterium]|nr:peptidoglycan-binding protein [Candidatus Liptonbacteria bacterium]
MKFFWVFLFALFSFVLFSFFGNPPILTVTDNLIGLKNNLAGIFFVASTSEELLKTKYAAAKNGGEAIRILIVPGHDSASVGAQFKNVKEADLTAELGERLAALFENGKEFEAITVRTKSGYSPEIASYLEKERSSIQAFRDGYRLYMKSAVDSGLVTRREGVSHNDAPEEWTIKLYGINKWANENDVDLVLHIHFNDHGGRPANRLGKYSGFAIYFPEKQFSNAEASAAVARNIFNRLSAYFAPSDMPQESPGIVEEQELIAVGSNNSLDPAGMLIEYDYIYEPQFLYPETRQAIIDELAFQTYMGIKDFFDGTATGAENPPETTLLPYKWNSDMKEGFTGSADVLSLQAALIREGVYPPPGFTRNDCPITGVFKKCTVAAVKDFQKEYGIGPTGYVGPQTRKILNEKYAPQQ